MDADVNTTGDAAGDTTPERRTSRGRLWVGALVVGAVVLTAHAAPSPVR